MRRTELRQTVVTALTALTVSTAALAAPLPAAQLSRATTKGTEPFAQCFAATQERSAKPWWFVPKEHGGTFSNLGASGVAEPYFVDIADKGTTREVRVTLASAGASAGAGSSVVRAVESCI